MSMMERVNTLMLFEIVWSLCWKKVGGHGDYLGCGSMCVRI